MEYRRIVQTLSGKRIIILVFILSLNIVSINKTRALEFKKSNINEFYLISPYENQIIENKEIEIIYFATQEINEIDLIINRTRKLENIQNHSKIDLEFRGVYNITAIALVDSVKLIDSIIFKYFPKMKFFFESFGIFPETAYIERTNTYRYEETFPNLNGKDMILNLSLNEKFANLVLILNMGEITFIDQNLTYFKWLNATTVIIKLPTEVYENLTYNKFIIQINSTLENKTLNIQYRFHIDSKSPTIEEYVLEFNLAREPLSGLVLVEFSVYDNIYALIPNMTLILSIDEKVLATEKDIQTYYIWSYPEYRVIKTINTEEYSNGPHILKVYLEDWAGNNVTYIFNITILNEYSQNTITTETSIIFFFVLFSLVTLSALRFTKNPENK